MRPRTSALTVSISCLAVFAEGVIAQDYPNKPIRVITAPAGGGSDFIARLVAQGISGPLGQQIIIDNQAGNLGALSLIKSPPDGYHLQVGGGSLWITPLLRKVPYDVATDFAPVSLLVREVLIVAVHPSLPVKTVKDLIALAKSRPAELNYSSGAVGGPGHLAVELMKHMAGFDAVHVAYKGNSPQVTALIGGEVQMAIVDAGLVTPHAKSGRLKALAVTSAQPSALTPGMPTVAATGLPGYEYVGMAAMFAPGRTPAAVIARVNQEVTRVLNRTDIKEKFIAAGVEAAASTPEELGAIIRSDMARLGKLIKDADIRVE